MELRLKYGCNPNQPYATVTAPTHPDSSAGPPLTVLNGNPSMINLLDALRGWQLVRDLKAATGLPAAASFKHVSPAGAAVAAPGDEPGPAFCQAHLYPPPEGTPEFTWSPLALAYAKARSSDRVASFGDFIILSDPCDLPTAQLIKPEVSDGILAPGYAPDALDLLKAKQGGNYRVLQIDPHLKPPATESRTVFGFTLEETYNDAAITPDLLDKTVTDNTDWPEHAITAMLTITAALKHTQSNSVAVGWDGQAVGIGAGQQSRIACVRLACDKADRFALKLHPKTIALVESFRPDVPRPTKVNLIDQFTRYPQLDDSEIAELNAAVKSNPDPITADEAADWIQQMHGVCLSSDAFFPFKDNLDRAARSNVQYVLQAGGSKRDDDVIAAANAHHMTMALSGLRLFLH
ncbi:MAG: phosphoribosylaminoimidazolecarboxamide formyltransferase [Planctomycetota bacterium]